MPVYTAPVKDLQFVLHEVLGIGASSIPGYADLDPDFTAAILDEAGKIARDVLAPLNACGDAEGCRLENGVVYTPKGFKEAFAGHASRAAGTDWTCPKPMADRACPIWSIPPSARFSSAANMAFNMYQGLTHGAIAAILAHGSDAQKQTYVPKMTSLDWTGTMNLTEPHCGTDLGLIRTRAEPQADGAYAITGSEDIHLGRRP